MSDTTGRFQINRHIFKHLQMKFWLLQLFTAVSLCSYAQRTEKFFADTIFIYKGFGSGGTTANLWSYSQAVDTMRNVTKVQLNSKSLDTLNFLIGHVKSKRHFQQKVGRSFYASIIHDGQERRIAVVPNWAIIDLQNKRQYVFKDTPYSEIYNRLVDGNYR